MANRLWVIGTGISGFIAVGFSLAATTDAHAAREVTSSRALVVAQAAAQPDGAQPKSATKGKVKKTKQNNNGAGHGGKRTPQPAPAGPPDPGKYL
jgi:hypothetical protein